MFMLPMRSMVLSKSLPAGKMRRSIGFLSVAALFSSSV